MHKVIQGRQNDAYIERDGQKKTEKTERVRERQERQTKRQKKADREK